MQFRRVTTGRTPEGKSVFMKDELVDSVVPPLLGGNELGLMWGTDTPVQLPTDGAMPDHHSFYPVGPGALRFILWRMPPRGAPAPDVSDPVKAREETERMVPHMFDLIEHREDDHATDTIDLAYVFQGKCDLTIGDGETRTIAAGDLLVQCNTEHAWANPYDEDCWLALVMYGALPAER